MRRKSKFLRGFMVTAVFLLAALIFVTGSTSPTAANATDPFLWPYNQPTNITFNQNDVYQAWVNWRNAQITANNAGGNGRLRVMGGVDDNSTVSEGMAYGILFASIFDEQNTFDGLYLFASDHFNEHGVMDWHIGNPGVRIGAGGATDAEVDMALGLVNACVKVQQGSWPASPRGINYCNAATAMINAIYTYEVDHPGSLPLAGLPNNPGNELIPGDTWNLAEDYPEGIINLSYFPPGYFEVFGKFTNNQAAWNAVINRNYNIVNMVQAKPGNCSGLVPNWNQYDGDAQLVSWQPNNYSWWSWDAARFAWRIAVDQAWYGRPQATETMNEIGGFFSSTGFNNIGEHSMNGQRVGGGPWPFFVANAGAAVWAAPNPIAVNCGTATTPLKESPQSAYNRVLNTSDNPNSYYGNAWRLLSMLLMTGNFPNFYEMAQGNLPTATPGVPTNTPSVPTNTPSVPTSTPVAPTPTQPSSGGVCQVNYAVVNSWSNVFQANVTITNNSSTQISGWTLTFTHAPGQTATGGWNATISQSGNNVTISNPASYWNGQIPANGGSATFGLQGTFTGSVVIPTNFVLNGVACNGNNPPPTNTPTPIPPTNTPTATPPVGNLPDLLIPFAPTITFENSGCYVPGTSLGTRVTVRNGGTANAGSFVVNINGTQRTVNSLAAGASVSIWVSGYSNPTAVSVDAANAVTESNEANNTFSGMIPVPTQPAPCATNTPTPGVPTATPTMTTVPPTSTPTSAPPTPTSPPAGSCSVNYTITNSWGSGFTADVTITNNGGSINGWTLRFNFPGNQIITNLWNGSYTQSGSSVTVNNASWNGTVPANGSTSFGFQASYSGSNNVPGTFTLNGQTCN